MYRGYKIETYKFGAIKFVGKKHYNSYSGQLLRIVRANTLEELKNKIDDIEK